MLLEGFLHSLHLRFLAAPQQASICSKMRRFYSVVVITSGSDCGTPGNGGSTPPKTFTFVLLLDGMAKMVVVVCNMMVVVVCNMMAVVCGGEILGVRKLWQALCAALRGGWKGNVYPGEGGSLLRLAKCMLRSSPFRRFRSIERCG